MIVSGSGSGKTNALLNLIPHQLDIDKMYLYVKDPCESKYQLLFKTCKVAGKKHCDNPKVVIEYLITMDDVYNNIDNHNPNRNKKYFLII